jgi:hypothetical protein
VLYWTDNCDIGTYLPPEFLKLLLLMMMMEKRRKRTMHKGRLLLEYGAG